MITAVRLPSKPAAKTGVYLKLRDRASYAFALVSVAAMVKVENEIIQQAHLALGGVAHKPWRLLETEAFLQGKPATATTFEEAAELALQDAQPLTHNQFKVKMSQRAIKRALNISTQGGGIA